MINKKTDKYFYMNKLKFAVLGCGFWSKFQIGAWSELEEVSWLQYTTGLYQRLSTIAEYSRFREFMMTQQSYSKMKSSILLIL